MTKTERERVVTRDSLILQHMDRKFIVHGLGHWYIAYAHSDGSGRYEPSRSEWLMTMVLWAREQMWWPVFVEVTDGMSPGRGSGEAFCSIDLLDCDRFADVLYAFLVAQQMVENAAKS